ncbi:hypothetical protein GH714_018197 [Hevea brasiliensis]|uniref:Uncharacterized protein n=1 Tax=Hevea brasiliensis TaxID=3981 RepID=A0A6A6N574_HEVBR|nr:hypothetical protein GH714_018197 [Hevea brasiliensis]
MGGVGKTTLARLVYNDELSQQNFHLKAWVCVSDEFDILRITKSILESITLQSCDLKELNQVQLQLHQWLAGKKFLIVLDDIWNNNFDDWNTLCSPLVHGAPGSTVIVTTRDMSIARMMKTIQSYNLNCISNEDCWLLFLDHAFHSRSVPVADPNLQVIREKVINKCCGLPLAARTLGGLLRSKPREDWENEMNSKIWYLQGDNNDILPVLRLSYYHLPSHLKRCFAYCAIFPKDYVFGKKQLALLWMAEGLIEQRDDQLMEDVGEEYFQDLCSRSLFKLQALVDLVLSFNHYNITELPDSIGDLKHLSFDEFKISSRALRISSLENLTNASNVVGAILTDKERIDKVVMKWGFRNTRNASHDRVVLEKMKPHGNLKELTDLFIKGLPNVKAVGREFYGESMSNSNPFPALETLHFYWMSEWEEWNFCGYEFSHLRELSIVRLTSLQNLSIAGRCPGVVSFPQDEIDMKLPTSLTSLTIEGLQDLIYLSNKGFRSLTSLEYLRIERCPKLAYFPKNGLPPSLLQLHIHQCPLLQQRCQKGKGQHWPELACIPEVIFNCYKEIFYMIPNNGPKGWKTGSGPEQLKDWQKVNFISTQLLKLLSFASPISRANKLKA